METLIGEDAYEEQTEYLRETGKGKRSGPSKEENASSSEKLFKNKYIRCKDDEHEWFDCPKYNKNSKFYTVIERRQPSKLRRNFGC